MKFIDAQRIVERELRDENRSESPSSAHRSDQEPQVGHPEAEPRARPAESAEDTRPSAEARRRPILPFFTVLIHGRDDRWNSEAVAGVETEHPSVGYARTIYLAIALNWVIDLFGLGYLFHTYLVSLGGFFVSIVAPVFLGMILSSGFAAFAVSLVKKPLDHKPFRDYSSLEIGGVAGVAFVCTLIILIGFVYDDRDSDFLTLLVNLAWLGIAGLGVAGLTLAFGVMDMFYVTTRMVVMVAVGYLVASPLHEAMFDKEIRTEYCRAQVVRLDAEIKKVEGNSQSAQIASHALCLEQAGLIELRDCDSLKASWQEAEFSANVSQILAEEERTGKINEQRRDRLRAQALSAGFGKNVVSQLDRQLSGHRGTGRNVQKLRKTSDEASGDAAKARDAWDECTTLNSEISSRNDEKVEACRPADVKSEQSHTQSERRIRRLGDERDQHEICGADVRLGAIDRALALEQIVRGAQTEIAVEADASMSGTETGASMSGIETDDSAHAVKANVSQASADIVSRKLFAAWILAFVMPLIVVVMKLTAGARLEPYLRSRWKGR